MGQAKARGTRIERVAHAVSANELKLRRDLKAIEQRHNPYEIPPETLVLNRTGNRARMTGAHAALLIAAMSFGEKPR